MLIFEQAVLSAARSLFLVVLVYCCTSLGDAASTRRGSAILTSNLFRRALMRLQAMTKSSTLVQKLPAKVPKTLTL
jgi:hypothetical protein